MLGRFSDAHVAKVPPTSAGEGEAPRIAEHLAQRGSFLASGAVASNNRPARRDHPWSTAPRRNASMKQVAAGFLLRRHSLCVSICRPPRSRLEPLCSLRARVYRGGHFAARMVEWSPMDQRRVNEAVRQCVQRCLAADKPLAALAESCSHCKPSDSPIPKSKPSGMRPRGCCL